MPRRDPDATWTPPATRAERAKLRLVSEMLVWLLTSRLPERVD